MTNKQFETEITKQFLRNKEVKTVYCIESLKKSLINNYRKTEYKDYIYTWANCKGIVVVNYCKK